MGKLIDLTDRTFDMLTVIKRVEDRKPGRPMWLCQCECGNTVVVSSTNLLRTNSTKSCGCLQHTPSPTLIDLRGKTFGKLKVIEKDPDSNQVKRNGFVNANAEISCLSFPIVSAMEKPDPAVAPDLRSSMTLQIRRSVFLT